MTVPLRLHVMDALWTLEHQMFLVGGQLGPQHASLMLPGTDYTVLTLRFSSIGGGKIVSLTDATSCPCDAAIGACAAFGPPPDPAYTLADRIVTLFCRSTQLAVGPQQLILRSPGAVAPPFGPLGLYPSEDLAIDGIAGRVLDREQVYWLLELVQAQTWRGSPAANRPFAPDPQQPTTLRAGTFLTIPIAAPSPD